MPHLSELQPEKSISAIYKNSFSSCHSPILVSYIKLLSSLWNTPSKMSILFFTLFIHCLSSGRATFGHYLIPGFNVVVVISCSSFLRQLTKSWGSIGELHCSPTLKRSTGPFCRMLGNAKNLESSHFHRKFKVFR